ncbi:hypothetical protein [Bacillus arachidis]|uniref:Uncharacterized protein n=1 Tax=Bacillus arachidis TaxID=2819290 RepID=A0ABS3NYS0_9BACI|nr:hypothetical protein [Bacillus arachidis]MBO1626077.1 hypothetical protein [Bacillus arachidis]
MNYKNNQEKEQIASKAEKVAIQYFKEQENIDITVTDFAIRESPYRTLVRL